MALNKISSGILGFKTGYTSQKFTATDNQTLFTLTNGSYQVGNGSIEIFVQGVKQTSDAYTETSSTSFTLSEGVVAGTIIEAVWIASYLPNSADVGDVTILKTSVKTVVPAINEHDDKIGVLTKSKYTAINVVEQFGAKGDGVNDDGVLIQQAINTFNTTNTTWSVSTIGLVLIPPGDFLIRSPLRMKEGVYIVGVSKYASRLHFDFSGGTDGITNVSIDGASFTKNFGFANLSFLPDYNKPGVGGVNFMNFVFAIEPYIHDCRFIQHKGAVGGGELDSTAIRLEKAINADFNNIVFDGGRNGIKCESTTDWGIKQSRLTNLFFYDQKDIGLNLSNGSIDNNISNIHIEQPSQSGLNYGIQMDSTSGGNTINGVTALGAQLKYGIICHSTKNKIDCNIKEALTKKILIDSIDNTIVSGSNSIVQGRQTLKTKAIPLNTINQWYSVANLHLGSNGVGTYITASISTQIESLGRRILKDGWFIERGTGAPTVTENTADKFTNAVGFEFQWIAGGTNNDMTLQVRYTTGTNVLNAQVDMQMTGGVTNDTISDAN